MLHSREGQAPAGRVRGVDEAPCPGVPGLQADAAPVPEWSEPRVHHRALRAMGHDEEEAQYRLCQGVSIRSHCEDISTLRPETLKHDTSLRIVFVIIVSTECSLRDCPPATEAPTQRSGARADAFCQMLSYGFQMKLLCRRNIHIIFENEGHLMTQSICMDHWTQQKTGLC